MQQAEVIQELLRNARPAPAALVADLQHGEKAVRAHDLGPVDVDAITAWVTEHGGREQPVPDADDVLWVVSEAELGL